MRTIGAALVLTGLASLLAPRARAADPDPWLGPDKALHYSFSAGIAGGGYAIGAALTPRISLRLAAGAGLALSAGIGKELYDATGGGTASFRDLTWDVLGTATGLLVAWTIDWLISGPEPERGTPAVAP